MSRQEKLKGFKSRKSRPSEFLENLDRQNNFERLKGNFIRDLSYLEIYKIIYNHPLGDKFKIKAVNIEQFNNMNVGLTRDMGLVNYLPSTDIYPNYSRELSSLYYEGNIFEKLYNNKATIDTRNLSHAQLKRSTMPITLESQIDKEKFELDHKITNHSNSSYKTNKGKDGGTGDESVEINRKPLTIDIGVIDGIIYTTTTSIPMGFLDPLHTMSNMEVNCTGVITNMISDILLTNSNGFDDMGNKISTLSHIVNDISNVKRLKVPIAQRDETVEVYLSENERTDESKVYAENHFENVERIVKGSYKVSPYVFPIPHLLRSDKNGINGIKLNVYSLVGKNKVSFDEDRIVKLIKDNYFLPIGSIQPLFKLIRIEDIVYVYPLSMTRNFLYSYDTKEENTDNNRDNLLGRLLEKEYLINSLEQSTREGLSKLDKNSLYSECFKIITDKIISFIDPDFDTNEVQEIVKEWRFPFVPPLPEIPTEYKCPEFLTTTKEFII